MIITNGKDTKFVQEKRKKKSEKRKKNEEQLREKSLILKPAQQVSKTIFVQNEVTN